MHARYEPHHVKDMRTRDFFFDTNVLIDLFYTQKPDWSTLAYSKIYKEMLEMGVNIYIDNTVLSEFVNRIIRVEYNLQQSLNPNSGITFKNYRNTEEGQERVREAYELVNVILKSIKLDGEVLTKPDIESLLVVDEIDYNDKTIEHLCMSKEYVLVTNDIDFSHSRADILSANHLLVPALF